MAKKVDWKDRAFQRCFGKPRPTGSVLMFGFTEDQLRKINRQLKALAKEGLTQSRWIFG
jgi:hypothetical protein